MNITKNNNIKIIPFRISLYSIFKINKFIIAIHKDKISAIIRSLVNFFFMRLSTSD